MGKKVERLHGETSHMKPSGKGLEEFDNETATESQSG